MLLFMRIHHGYFFNSLNPSNSDKIQVDENPWQSTVARLPHGSVSVKNAKYTDRPPQGYVSIFCQEQTDWSV